MVGSKSTVETEPPKRRTSSAASGSWRDHSMFRAFATSLVLQEAYLPGAAPADLGPGS
jgi:hypothetical protein